jgi:ubiquinone/menaquinone biosynthesis C-methylase UbiE
LEEHTVPESTANTAKLTKFYGDLSPTVDMVREALAIAGIDPDHARARDLYERDLDCHNLGMFRMVEFAADVAAEYGAPGADDLVLDVGCGIGGPSRYLADRFWCPVIGIDVVPVRTEVAEELADMTGMGDRVSYRVADATALDFDDASFAQAWMLDVSIHIRDKRTLFREIARILRPGGFLVMHEQTGPLPRAMAPVMREAPYIAPSLPQLIRYIEDAGMRMLTWRDTTSIAVDYFLGMRDLLLGNTEPPESNVKTGVPLLDGYLETFANLNGRTGVLVARLT